MKVLTALRRTWSMPLLGKELVEQANRRRTYIVRMLYAGLLFFAASIFIYEQFHRYSASGFEVLGRGAELFAAVVAFQFFGVYLFLPAVMVSAITLEKERESLALLLITSLGPWQIILQKYFGRLVPMLTFLLLSMPLLAVSYSLGGLSSDEVLAAILLLGLCCLQVGAFCLMLSAYCITTSTAFVLSYLLGACVFFGPVMLVLMATGFSGPGNIEPIWFLFHFPPAAFAYALDNSPDTLMCAVWCSIPIAGSTLVFLIMARRFLISRAFVQPKSIVLKLFRALDGFYHKVNFGDVVVMRGAPPLPVDRPVAWWEVTRRAMGQPQYLFRILTAVMLPMLLIVTVSMTRGGGGRGTSEVLSVGYSWFGSWRRCC
jgi:ABC-type transport system involved in multi-copper enzyme maturation permease subunit